MEKFPQDGHPNLKSQIQITPTILNYLSTNIVAQVRDPICRIAKIYWLNLSLGYLQGVYRSMKEFCLSTCVLWQTCNHIQVYIYNKKSQQIFSVLLGIPHICQALLIAFYIYLLNDKWPHLWEVGVIFNLCFIIEETESEIVAITCSKSYS